MTIGYGNDAIEAAFRKSLVRYQHPFLTSKGGVRGWREMLSGPLAAFLRAAAKVSTRDGDTG